MSIDVHCHLTGGEYQRAGGLSAVLSRAREAGVTACVCSGFDLPSSAAAAGLAEKYEDVYFCAGFQPQELKKYREGDLGKIKALTAHPKCVAVGEIGLDYHYPDNPARELQKEIFSAQLKLADEAGLPVVVHSRDAAADTLELLKDNAELLKRGGLLHCYSYSAEMLREFAALGFYFSFGGTSTYKGAKKVQESVRRTPADPSEYQRTGKPHQQAGHRARAEGQDRSRKRFPQRIQRGEISADLPLHVRGKRVCSDDRVCAAV